MIEAHIYSDRNQLDISFKKAAKYKFFKHESGEPKWMFIAEIKDDQITVATNKDAKTLKSYFDGILSDEFVKVETA